MSESNQVSSRAKNIDSEESDRERRKKKEKTRDKIKDSQE